VVQGGVAIDIDADPGKVVRAEGRRHGGTSISMMPAFVMVGLNRGQRYDR